MHLPKTQQTRQNSSIENLKSIFKQLPISHTTDYHIYATDNDNIEVHIHYSYIQEQKNYHSIY